MIRYGILEQMKYGLAVESYDSDLVTYWTGLSTPLSTTQKDLLQTFVTSLKTGLGITNLSDAFDVLYILANETSEAALRNLVKRQHDCSVYSTPSAPTFTQYEGYAKNSTNIGQYIESNYNPSIQGVKYKLDDAAYILYIRNDLAANAYPNGIFSETAGVTIGPKFIDTNTYFGINGGATQTTTIPRKSNGMWFMTNPSTNNMRLYRNKQVLYNSTKTTVTPANYSMGILRSNGNVNYVSYHQYALMSAGKALNASEMSSMYDAFESYMEARDKGYITFDYPSVLKDGSTVGWYVSDASSTTMYFSQDTSVYAWNDILGSGHDLIQATGSKQPKWTSDGVLFDGVDDYLQTLAFTYNQPAYIYMVATQKSFVADEWIFQGIATGAAGLRNVSPYPNILLYSGATGNIISTTNSNWTINNFAILRLKYNGASSSIQINATTPTTGDMGTNYFGGFTLGGRANGTSTVNIQVKEIILRNVADNETDETAIYNYLANKYGIT